MATQRYDGIDTLRGVAIVWMTIYHLCFDLNHFGWLHQRMLVDPFWVWQRTAIVCLFLFCAGLGQAVAQAQGSLRFWRRWGQIVAGALVVSVATWWQFPQSYVHFGVLHGIAAMLLVLHLGAGATRLSVTSGRLLWLLGFGLVALVLPWFAGGLPVVFNGRALNWLGMVSAKPVTQDYVPLLPWLGVMCWGVATGHWLMQRQAVCLSWGWRPLALLGRWSLSYYMLHQPVLWGTLLVLQGI